jgi:hypothetical protein
VLGVASGIDTSRRPQIDELFGKLSPGTGVVAVTIRGRRRRLVGDLDR